ncbi:hypothetical protein Nepgr_017455 [Nepenthes gracilis]|uniref:Uncharacterized protein n=1 Tax=Nepenthes gracilis TaxID=150966 RepID=A0AAD3XT39_NEPGR|nr:hypothetical protein Nepgr_017455 [Nepenthes gracilis]
MEHQLQQRLQPAEALYKWITPNCLHEERTSSEPNKQKIEHLKKFPKRLGPVLLLLHPDACIAGVGVWRVAVGFCFYVKVSLVLLLLCSTADDGAAGLGAGAFCCRALPCHCVNYANFASADQFKTNTRSAKEQQSSAKSTAPVNATISRTEARQPAFHAKMPRQSSHHREPD